MLRAHMIRRYAGIWKQKALGKTVMQKVAFVFWYHNQYDDEEMMRYSCLQDDPTCQAHISVVLLKSGPMQVPGTHQRREAVHQTRRRGFCVGFSEQRSARGCWE